MKTQTSSKGLLTEVLAGRTRAIARLISCAETNNADYSEILANIYHKAGQAHVVGITGVPGSGKSTLLRSLVQTIRGGRRTVGVIAIDPSSPFSGGAILGDRIRMLQVSEDPGVFIRSMATRGALGGLARATLDVVDILDAAGFDVIIIETVGVGQDEVDVVQAAHSTVVVSAPGLGDDIQAIKAGILEIADIHVVNKSDRPDANKTITDLTQMLATNLAGSSENNWTTPILPVSASNDHGVADLLKALEEHRAFLQSSGEIVGRRRRIAMYRILKTVRGFMQESMAMSQNAIMQDLLDRVLAREIGPRDAALQILASVNENNLK